MLRAFHVGRTHGVGIVRRSAPKSNFAPYTPIVRSLGTNATSVEKKDEIKQPTGFWDSLIDKYGPASAVAPEGYTNRWAMVVPAFLTHLAIGAPYAWSALSGTLIREQGFVTAAAADWSLSEVTLPLSIVFLLHGMSAAALGRWQMKVGPRISMGIASACFGGGLMLGAAGISMHELWMVYLGYGVFGGLGLGLAYTPPVQTLVSWFPDRKGLASGLAIGGFGSGALIFTPAIERLMAKFAEMPTFVGAAGDVATVTRDGRLFADLNGSEVEVVHAGASDLARLPYDLVEGFYAVGTGSTGAATALGVMGAAYFALMAASAYAIRNPHKSYVPAGYTPPDESAAASGSDGGPPKPSATRAVELENVMKTPQYYLLGSSFFVCATGGMAMFAVAKPLMNDVFASTLPSVVTPAFASAFVLTLAAGNLGGRLAWSALSDSIGRRNTFHIFTLGSIPLYASTPFLVNSVIESGSVAPLAAFMASSAVAMSIMGGSYAIMPAYESDLFGSKYVGAVHGRMLLFSSAAALAGPSLLLSLRAHSEKSAIQDLLAKVDPAKFREAFATPIEDAAKLIETKTLTINRLMDIMPAGTQDPTPFLYNTTMYTMGGLMACAALSHYLVGPVKEEFFEQAPAVEEVEVKEVEVTEVEVTEVEVTEVKK